MPRPNHTRLAARRSRALRRDLTTSEAASWADIKGAALGARFRRQVPIGDWIADFACFEPKLVIEVDDVSHDYREERGRTKYIEAKGFTILRFDNREIADPHVDHVGTIERWIGSLRQSGQAPTDKT